MLEKDRVMEIPAHQRMERQESLVREHSEEYKAALQRAVALDIPQAYSSSPYGTFHETGAGESSGRPGREDLLSSSKKRRESWDDFVERMFDVDETGQVVFKKQ